MKIFDRFGVSTKIEPHDDNYVRVTTTYDLTNPNCPMVVWNFSKSPFEINKAAEFVEETRLVDFRELDGDESKT